MDRGLGLNRSHPVYCCPMMCPGPHIVTRFAPSPTGYLHLGHLVNAIYVWGLAERWGGQVLLRLEDHDRGRCRPEYEVAILEDLDWLGLQADGGGPIYRQSERHARYVQVLDELVARNLVYTCTCSRKEIVARTGGGGGELRYDGHCRGQGYRPEQQGGLRLLLDDHTVSFEDLLLGPQTQCPARQCGDLLLRDRHDNWTYQFAVTVDDWDQGVNRIVRGEDLLESTGRQIQLAQLLGRPDGAAFLHHPLISDPGGHKLSKRDFAKGIRDYRAEGHTAADVLGKAAAHVGLWPDATPLAATDLGALFPTDTNPMALARNKHVEKETP